MVPIILLLFWTPTEPIPTVNAAELKKEQEACWADLLKHENETIRATLKLSNRPKETVHFLKEKIVPVKIKKDAIIKLLKELESEEVRVWKPAFEQLQLFDPRLVMSLKEAFESVAPGIGQPRIVSILVGMPLEDFEEKQFTLTVNDENNADFRCGNHGWQCSPTIVNAHKLHWIRLNRSITLLEHIGTLEAIDVLKTIAKSHPDIGPTKAAKAALKRLNAE